jgi:hypothetical protein
MGTDKVHFMIHAVSEIMKWGSIINCSAEVVEQGHKTWVKEQGQNTNQGDSSAKTMMSNSPWHSVKFLQWNSPRPYKVSLYGISSHSISHYLRSL